jgi:sec-independent protein translocase protein TatC
MKKYTVAEHFLELKSRIVKVLLFFIVAFFICYYYSDFIYSLLLMPLSDLGTDTVRKIIYTGLTEAFITYLKLSSFIAFLFTIPVLCYQFYAFISPGLTSQERNLISFVLILSPILFTLGAFFVFYFVMPRAWAFFLSFENNQARLPLVLEARISEYLSLVIQLIYAFGFAFQVPIIMIILSILGLIRADTLRNKRRFAIVINFILAAIFTPPDILSQIALAIPLLLLYEISILLCQVIENKGAENVGSEVD